MQGEDQGGQEGNRKLKSLFVHNKLLQIIECRTVIDLLVSDMQTHKR